MEEVMIMNETVLALINSDEGITLEEAKFLMDEDLDIDWDNFYKEAEF